MITPVAASFAIACFGLWAWMSLRLLRSLRRATLHRQAVSSADLPTVSICIPARNETHAMTQCLERALASDYKKLEIIVFDDSSTDDTSVLIRSFAHAGVRFVPGTALPAGWLGKNHALEVLASEASGQLLLFLDVDTTIKPSTVSQLVGEMMAKQLSMLSVIPRRYDLWRVSVIFGQLRFFWELVLASRRAPAVSSMAWMIERPLLLERFGGFSRFSDSVRPEAKMAAALETGRYHGLVSDDQLGVGVEKKWRSQLETNCRLLYMMAGGTAFGAVRAIAGLLLLIVPVVVVALGFVTGWTGWQLVFGIELLLFGWLYMVYARRVWQRGWWLALVVWPAVIVQELIVFIDSTVRYATHRVTWKGRLVTSTGRATTLVVDE